MRVIVMLLCVLLLFSNHGFSDGLSGQKQLQKATFAGGCFWCMQPFFDRLKGVESTVVGYTGGRIPNPTYEQVSSGTTGHAEAIEITYDPALVDYEQLLNIYWRNIDPTVKDKQFYDRGTQYRTAIFYHDQAQRTLAEDSRDRLDVSGKFDKPIVTEIVPASEFYPAEDEHQKYYQKNSQRYERYHKASGRDSFFRKIWGKERD